MPSSSLVEELEIPERLGDAGGNGLLRLPLHHETQLAARQRRQRQEAMLHLDTRHSHDGFFRFEPANL